MRRAVDAETAGAIALRREIHQHPDLAGDEARTADRIVSALAGLGLEVRTGVGGHGIVAVLRGGMPGPVVAYRAELDAVAGDEAADLPFRSGRPGVAHLCGHDLHAAIAVGVARVLAARAKSLTGSVLFLFQPAEETLAGAAAMIEAGAIADPVPDAIFAMHSWPMPTGRLACGAGVGFSGLDLIEIELTGLAARPETVTEIRIQIDALATIAFPTTPEGFGAVLAAFEADDGILADAVFVATNESASQGTSVITAAIKATRPERYAGIRKRVRELVEQHAPVGSTVTAAADPFPAMINDPTETRAATALLEAIMGYENIARYRASSPFNGEDFGLFLERIPGTMLLLGVADYEKGRLGVPHQPDFVADEAAIGVGMLAATAVILGRLGVDLGI